MPTIYKRNCDYCGNYYEKPSAKYFCSKQCAGFGLSKEKRKKLSLIAKKNFNKDSTNLVLGGWNKGKKNNWMSGNKNHNHGKFGEKHPTWKGGKYSTSSGRVRVYKSNGIYVNNSRTIMENKLGRKLLSSEVVHHIDFDKSNDHPDNLQLFSSQSEHSKYHALLRKAVNKL